MRGGERWLEVADRIGARLCRDSVWRGEACLWLGPPTRTGGFRRLASLGGTLYAGSAGIGLFLAALARATGEAAYARHARGAFAFAEAEVRAGRVERPGFHFGLSGIAYALLLGGSWLEDERYRSAATALIQSLPHAPDPVWPVDVVSGIAGVVLVLDHAAGMLGMELDDRMRHYADALVARAETSARGLAWAHPGPGRLPLLGFAHGVAGIAAALHRAGVTLGERSLCEAASAAIGYERSFFDQARGNWPDFRDVGRVEDATFMLGWCHGAPGIAASRLMVGAHGAELDAALAATEASLTGSAATGNACLCHGAFGNADILLSAWRVTRRPTLWTEVAAFADAECRRVHDTEGAWRLGGEIEYRQFMTGIAGIGYFYLRLASEGELSSVLVP